MNGPPLSPCTLGLVLFTSFFQSGCALTSKADVVAIHYYTPERDVPRLTSSRSEPKRSFDVRLGRIFSGPHLRDRIAYRDGAYQVGYYEDRRWTERPETYVRRKLGHALFEEHGFHRVIAGAAPTLDVEVIGFDELRLPEGRAVRVELKVLVFEDDRVLLEDTLSVDRSVSPAKFNVPFERVVASMAEALEVAGEEVASRLQAALEARTGSSVSDAGFR